MEKKWTIINLKSHTSSGGIIQADVRYHIFSMEQMLVAKKDMTVEFEYDTENENFIEFNNITEEIVINWCKENLDHESIEAEVQSDYDAQLEARNEVNTVTTDLPENFVPRGTPRHI